MSGYFYNFEKLSYIQGKKTDGCILCKIAESSPDVPDLSVYKDEFFVVSLNLYPFNPGHLMIFPVTHHEDIRKFTPAEDKRLNALLHYFLDILDKTHHPEGYNIGYNMGLPAGASISHLHLHVIPRYSREIGIADLIGGKRVLVEDPMETIRKIRKEMAQRPFSISMT
ncbi:MAG: HIT family protein [Spirochaetaceae bacterium]|nr:MAG: HIT family protein [Spirochaetaceae bacterium]